MWFVGSAFYDEMFSFFSPGIKLKKLSKYEKEWVAIKAAERAREDPVIRFERENKKLLSELNK